MSAAAATIAFVSHTSELYGAPESLLLLLERLDRDRYRPFVFCPYRGPLVERLEGLGVTVDLGITSAQKDRLLRAGRLGRVARRLGAGPGYVRRLWRALRGRQPALVYLNSIGIATPALCARLCGVPTIVHVRESRSYFRGLGNRVRRLPLLRSARRFVAVSHAVHEVLVENGVAAERITVVHNGVDLERCSYRADARTRVRGELGVGDDEVLVGLVGAVEPRKGVLDLIEAAALLEPTHPSLRFVVVGGVKDRAYARIVERRIRDDGLGSRVALLGFRGDVHDVFSALDVVANPTREEPFARVNIEAMAAARPVVATAVDGNGEAVLDGVTGRLCAPADPVALAAAIASLAEDPALRETMGAAARRRVELCFDADRYVAGIEAVLEDELRRTTELAVAR